MADHAYADPPDARGLAGVGPGNDGACDALSHGTKQHRQDAACRANRAGEGELAEDHRVPERVQGCCSSAASTARAMAASSPAWFASSVGLTWTATV